MEAIGLNPIRLDAIGIDPIRLNAIRLGVPGASSGSDRPYIDPEVLASLKAVCICYGKSNDDPDRAIVKNLVDPSNPFIISNAAYTEGSGYADKGSPYYGAFVTDGIDDLITSTKTLAEMGITDEVTVVSMIHQIALNTKYNLATTNYIENLDNGKHIRSDVYSAGKTGIYGYSSSLINNNTNDIKNILGDRIDYAAKTDNASQVLSNGKFSVVGRARNHYEVSSIAWYWTIIANKVLTTDQINQVIAYFNLDRTLRPDILCNTIKQGITNENHASFGDKLIDFSGNGRDIQLNNIAWDGDSGIGKYNYPNWKVNVTRGNKYGRIVYYDSINGTYSADFKGVTELYKSYGLSVEIRVNRANTVDFHSIKEDGIYTITPPDDTTSMDIRFGGENVYNASCDITITQIPSHAGALCLDGVNDFGKVTGMPIYKDYTVIVEREILSVPNLATTGSLVSKAYAFNKGAFIVEDIVQDYARETSFSNSTDFTDYNIDRSIIYQSKYSYNGKALTAGQVEDRDAMWLGTIRDNDSRFLNGAIYFLMSFPYSMSEFLIERQLKKHKVGTLYEDYVKFNPVIKSNANYNVFYTALLPLTGDIWDEIKIGDYVPVDRRVAIQLSFDSDLTEITSAVSSQLDDVTFVKNKNNIGYTIFGNFIKGKSPQIIDVTVAEYIRYEDIVQPYPIIVKIQDNESNKRYTYGDKIKVGTVLKYTGNTNLLPELYKLVGDIKLNNKPFNQAHTAVIEKTNIFTFTSPCKYLKDNEPKCILSPRLLRMPNSSYKILGHIPDISGHGNHGVIRNSAYAEGSGANEDGSYQFDGVDDFVTIPTLSSGGKQVLMKVNWHGEDDEVLYDQRNSNIQGNYDLAISTYPDTIAYNFRNEGGKTFIDGILNHNIVTNNLKSITHNITSINGYNNDIDSTVRIGRSVFSGAFSKMALYDFMLFDKISTEDEIKELNEYIGIEAKLELPPYYWDTYGKTNLDDDRATIQQRGVAIGDYDLTNNNFAYDKMSGYGGYNLGRFNNDWSYTSNNDSIEVISRDSYSVTLKNLSGTNDWKFNNTKIKIISDPITVRFKSDKEVIFTCDYHYFSVGSDAEHTIGHTGKRIIAGENTDIIIPPISQENIDKYNMDISRGYYLIYFRTSPTLSVDEEVTIEMLPMYPNGLVYDGVTDYSENVNIPALTDYTYIFKRKLLKDTTGSASMNKGLTNQQRATVIDFISLNGNIEGYSFGKGMPVSSLRDSDIIYGTTNNVNGTNIIKGSNPDSNGIHISKFADWYRQMVFYKLILYPKTIPLLQINYLKNLMEKDEIIDLTNPIFIQE